jgi:hypothetical protein
MAESDRRADTSQEELFDLDGPTIIRMCKNRANPYVMINRRALEDDRLSWAARGLMAYLLAKPDDWEVRPGDLQRNGGCGKHAVRSILTELETYGYLWRHKVNGEGGKFTWVHRVYESPDLNPRVCSQLQPVEAAPKAEKPSPENRPMVRPSPENPSTAEPSLVEPPAAQPSAVQPSPENRPSYMNNHVPSSHVLNNQPDQTHTHQEGAAAPAPVVVGVSSRFSLEDCRRYAEHLKSAGEGITNPGGYAASIHRSGRADSQIEAFLAAGKPPGATLEPPPQNLLDLIGLPNWRPRCYAQLSRMKAETTDKDLQGRLDNLVGAVYSTPLDEFRLRTEEFYARQSSADVAVSA